MIHLNNNGIQFYITKNYITIRAYRTPIKRKFSSYGEIEMTFHKHINDLTIWDLRKYKVREKL